MSKIKVLYISHVFNFGGANTSLWLLLKSLRDFDIETRLSVTSVQNWNVKEKFNQYCLSIDQICFPNIMNDVYNSTPFIFVFLKQIFKKKQILEIIDKHKPDIIHLNSIVLSLALKIIKRNTNVKVVMHVREQLVKHGFGLTQKFIINQIQKYADAIITISPNEAKYFKDKSKIKILANPFDFSELVNLKQSNFKEKYKISKEDLIIGMLGQFHKGKGHIRLIETCRIIKEKFPGVKFKLAIIGVGFKKKKFYIRTIKKLLLKKEYGIKVKNIINKYGLNDTVVLVNFENDILPLLNEIDILVRPSLANDPWGRDIIEGMALGKPIIASGTSSFFIKNNVNGFLIDEDFEKQAANKIMQLIIDNDKRVEMSKASYLISKEKCSLKKFGENLYNIYKEILK